MIKVRVEGDPVAHSVEEEKLHAECFGDEEYARKLGFLEETIGLLGFPVELDRRWIEVANLRYREDKKLKGN